MLRTSFQLSLDTRVAVPGGFETLRQIKRRLDNGEDVVAFAFEGGRVVPTTVTQVNERTLFESLNIQFDDGTQITCSRSQELLLRDGKQIEANRLIPNTSMMPFEKMKLNGGYWYIYTIARNGACGKGSNWYSEHRMLAEFVLERKLKLDEVVHHIDFDRNNNSLSNLTVMSSAAHTRLHEVSVQAYNAFKWGPSNREWQEKFKREHSIYMTEHNPAERVDITFELVLEWCQTNSFRREDVASALNCNQRTVDHKLRSAGFNCFSTFARAYDPSWKANGGVEGSNNPRWKQVTFQEVCNAYQPGKQAKQIAAELNTTLTVVIKRVRMNGFNGWKDFVARYKNHKIVTVTPLNGELQIAEVTTTHGTIAVESTFVVCQR